MEIPNLSHLFIQFLFRTADDHFANGFCIAFHE